MIDIVGPSPISISLLELHTAGLAVLIYRTLDLHNKYRSLEDKFLAYALTKTLTNVRSLLSMRPISSLASHPAAALRCFRLLAYSSR